MTIGTVTVICAKMKYQDATAQCTQTITFDLKNRESLMPYADCNRIW